MGTVRSRAEDLNGAESSQPYNYYNEDNVFDNVCSTGRIMFAAVSILKLCDLQKLKNHTVARVMNF